MKPSVDKVKAKYGPDTALLYEKALSGKEFDISDILFADNSKEHNDPLSPLVNWNLMSLDGAAEFFIREIELDTEE